MKSILRLTALLLISALPCIAADAKKKDKKKKNNDPLLSLERIYAKPEFGAKSYSVKWLGPGQGYARTEKSKDTKDAKDIVQIDPESGDSKILVPAAALIPKGKEKPIGLSGYEFSADLKKVLIYTNSKRVWRSNTRGDYWILNLPNGKLRKLGGKQAKPSTLMFATFSPDGSKVAYVRERSLYVEDLADHSIQTLAKSRSKTEINGTFDWVYEEELSLRKGFRWSPDSKSIAYWQIDEAGVRDMRMINNTDDLYPKIITFKYPKTGERNAKGRVGVANLQSSDTTWMSVPGDPRNHYIARMDWADNSRELILQQLNRLQNTNLVMLANVWTGDVKTVFTDRDDAWVDVRYDFLKWVNDGRQFTFVSERDGWRRVYLVSRDGTKVAPITTGDFDVIQALAVDDEKDLLYFIASPDDPTQRFLYCVGFDGKGLKQLSPAKQKGSHSYRISPDAHWAVHDFSNADTPSRVTLVKLPEHKSVKKFERNRALRKKLDRLKRPTTEFFRVNIGDGVKLDGSCILPPDFDPTKKYPLLIYVYGEPAGQTVVNRWRGNSGLWNWMLAQRGYILMSFDNRGTPSPRGNDWRKIVYRQVGILAPKEQAAALKQVMKDRPYIDAKRVGIWGWSGGGSMTLNAMFKFPELYKTGISIAPVPDQRLYDTIYQERYMGLPKDNKAGYKDGSAINYVKGLKGNLLLVHGTGDDNVHFQGLEKLINELIAHGKKFEMMAYPNRTHAIREGKGTSLHLRTLMTDYLMEKLPAGGR